jgi:hypothetical protein
MFKKRVIIFFFGFLFLQNQFLSVAIADTCENFYKAITEQVEITIPSEEIIDLGIYFNYGWDQTKQKKIIDRNKNNFPIIRFSLLEDKLTSGTVIKTIDGIDLSEEHDDSIQELFKNSKSSEVEFFDENKVNKIKLSSKKYEAIFFFFNNFTLNSINEIVSKEGFFAIDYNTTFAYKRTDLKKEGKYLLNDSCPLNEDIEKKNLYHPEDQIELIQFEVDADKIDRSDDLYYDGSTWLQTSIDGLARIRTKFDFSKFPFDTQVLNITYLNALHFAGEDKTKLFLMIPSEQVFKNLNSYMNNNYLQEWNVVNTQVYSESTWDQNNFFSDTLTFSLEVERSKMYYIFKIILPVLLILSVAWYVLWIPTDDIESRLTTSIVALLSLIAYNFVFQDVIPKLDILTSLDKFILLSYLFCAIPIFTTIRLSKTVERRKKRSSYLNKLIRRWGLAIYIFGNLTIFYPVL